MNVALWIAAALLAVVYVAAGLPKVLQPRDKLVSQMKWAADFSDRSVRGIGAVELLGAIGVIVPGIIKIAPLLVPLAAVGLAILQVGAVAVNVRYDETNRLPLNVALILLAVFVAWGRFGPYPL
jgi:uncharacterized membrane protein YphA (DoxX/SURF4 family)